jgi:hypothetical protein
MQVQGVLIEQHQAIEQENISLQAKFDVEKSQIQQGKEQFLAEKLKVKEAVNRALRSVKVVEIKAKYRVTQQVEHLEEVIQQLQQCITDLELCTVPETPQDVKDQREATVRSAVEILKAPSMEYKHLSDRSALTYERLTESPELRALESQLQEAKYQAETI